MAALSAITTMVIEKIVDLIKRESSLRAELDTLQSELRKLMCFVKDAAEKQETDQIVRDFVREIEETLYEAEDRLDKPIFLKAFRSKGEYIKHVFKRCWAIDEWLGSREGNKITILKEKVRAFNKKLELYGIEKTTTMEGVTLIPEDEQLQQRQQSHCRQDSFVVGLKDDVEKLVSILVNKEQDQTSPILGIYGIGGLGKSTLAKMLYNDPKVLRHFEGFAWANVPQKFQTRKILEDIFLQLVPESEEEIMTFSNIELAQELYEVQLSKKFLIVLDDVWNKDVWKCLNLAFPSQNTASKLVVTTRSTEVADKIADNGIAHRMRTLTEEESWELFVQKAFSGGGLDERQEIGKELVKMCSGLPSAIVSLGKLLGRKHTLNEWKVVHQRIDWNPSTELGSVELSKIPRELALYNYHELPHYLKACFLYLGLFPQDTVMNCEKLKRLWIAEGFVSSTAEKDLEEVAERYLNELISRSLIQVVKPTSRWLKTVHVHDLTRDFCVSKGKEENFIELMNVGSEDQLKHFHPKARRLALCFEKNEDRHLVNIKNDKTHRLRSLLLFNGNQRQKDTAFPPDESDLKKYRSLRILHFDGFKFGTKNTLKGIGKLISLRYLSLGQCSLDKLSSSIGKLFNLQTLDLRVQSSTKISVPNVLWKIERLRHLYLPLLFWVDRDEKLRLDTLKKLETLFNFDASLCNTKDLSKLTNICYLTMTTEGDLEDLDAIASHLCTKTRHLRQLSLNVRSINCYSEREHSILRNLFQCLTLYDLRMEGHIGNLPWMISPSLTELVLSGAELNEDPMATLEKFPRLWILELNNDAFLGKQMVCSASGFPRLSHLKLSNLQNLEKLSIEKGAMANLSTLAIQRCKRLNAVPEGFNNLTSLQKLNIDKCNLEPGIVKQGKSSEVWNVHANKNDDWD